MYRRRRPRALSCPWSARRWCPAGPPPRPAWLACRPLARALENGGFGAEHAHEVIPGSVERFGTVVLKLLRKRVDVDLRPGEVGQHLFGIAAVRRHRRAD